MANSDHLSDFSNQLRAIKQSLNILPDYITLVDMEGLMRFVSRADYGLKEEDMLGQHFTMMLPEEFRDQVVDDFNNCISSGKGGQSTAKVAFPDGSKQWFTSITKPIMSNDEVVGVAFISRNVSAEKEMETAFKESEDRFRKLVEIASDIIYSCDYKGNFTYVNPVALHKLGYDKDELIGNHFTVLIHPGYVQEVEIFYKNQFESRIHNTYNELPVVTKSGETVWVGQNVQMKIDDNWIHGFQALARDITERKEFERQLIEARKRAEESSRAKEQFLSVMSHEIRTPLNAVLGLTNLLLQEKPTKKQLENLRAIKYSADNLLNIINDILDFSKIESGKITFENESFRVDYVLEGVQKAMQTVAANKGVELLLEIDDKIPKVVVGDSIRLNQILFNLISNGIKFTEEGHVLIKADLDKMEDDTLIVDFHVQDTGIGIAKDKQELIFESFTQASKATTRKYGGTGLGLTITKQIVELQGGTIQVKSKPEEGTTFSVKLRFKKPRKKVDLSKNDMDGIKTFEKFIGVRCMLVEDNRMNQLVASKYLEKWGISFEIAENGIEAIKLLKTKQFDFILMDLEMPDLDGYATTEHIRTQLKGSISKIPIVAVTASAFSNVRNRVLASGMNDYVSKPFEPSALYSIIARITKQNREAAQKYLDGTMFDDESLVDLSYLKEASAGDSEFVTKMIDTFIKHSPEYIEKFHALHASQDLIELKRLAHKYKATVSIVGIKKIEKIIESLEENIAEKKNLDELQEQIDMIETLTNSAIVDLNELSDRFIPQ